MEQRLFPSFSAPCRVVVIGATGGVGGAIADLVESAPDVERLVRIGRSGGDLRLDLTDEASVAAAAAAVGRADIVICATGLLHDDAASPEKTWAALDPAAMARVLAVNTIGPALVAKHFLPILPREGRAVFAALSARIGSIGDNKIGGWVSYRASKAALNQVIRTFSVELARKNRDALIVGLHPGTVDTGLSKPFQRGHEIVAPAEAAANLMRVLDGLTPADSGGQFAWDGARVPD